MYRDTIALIIAFSRLLSAAVLSSRVFQPPDGHQAPFPLPPNDGIHLAIAPTCGHLFGDTADINAGIRPDTIKTIVSFGDSYTDGGKDDGSPLDPPILVPPSPLAGGRSTNGLTWVEHVANDLNATIKDYAQAGACIDLSLWPSNPRKVDFLGQVDTFLGQNNTLDPHTTLYSIFFGINDYLASLIDGDHLPQAAQVLLNQISILSSPPTNARNFMISDVYGRGTTTPSGEIFKQTIYTALSQFHTTCHDHDHHQEPQQQQYHQQYHHQPQQPQQEQQHLPQLSISYINLANIWQGILGPNPGFQAFGYRNTDSCTQCTDQLGCTTIGMCDDPEHYFYWIPGHPSKETMRIMADYVGEVWEECRV